MRNCGYIVILLTCLSLSACTFGGFEPVQVVERSREGAPEWTKAGDVSSDSNGLLTVVHTKSKLPNLPLGAKETQIAAYALSEQSLNKKISDTLRQKAANSQIALTNTDALASLVAEETKASHGKYAVVSDLYYEKVRDSAVDDGVIYYSVFVKVDYPAVKADELMGHVGERLRVSTYSDLQSLGNILNGASPSGLVGH